MNQPLLQMDLRLVAGAVAVLAGAVIAIWLVGRRLRASLGPAAGGEAPRDPGIPPQVVKELQARGLATPAQLATMTDLERQLLFSTMAGALDRAADGESRPRVSGARALVTLDELPPLHCPLCSYRIERFTTTVPITGQCETCGAKVVVRRDATRLLLTVVPSPGRSGGRFAQE